MIMQGILDASDGWKKLVLLNTRTPDKKCSEHAALVHRISRSKDFSTTGAMLCCVVTRSGAEHDRCNVQERL